MQARSPGRKKSRRHPAGSRRAEREDRVLHQPRQNPPVDRLYMRPLVGRGGKPAAAGKGGKAPKAGHAMSGGDYVVELTTFHIRPRRHS